MFVPYCFKIGRECPFAGEIEVEDDFAFVLMPFAPKFDKVYQAIKEVWEEMGFRCLRSDEDIHTHDIMCKAICQNIQRARFIIADMTGRNPNVFYELGLAHAFGKPVILITQHPQDVPFDLKPMLFIDYGEDIEKLKRELKGMIEGLLAKGVTPKPLRPTPKELALEEKPKIRFIRQIRLKGVECKLEEVSLFSFRPDYEYTDFFKSLSSCFDIFRGTYGDDISMNITGNQRGIFWDFSIAIGGRKDLVAEFLWNIKSLIDAEVEAGAQVFPTEWYRVPGYDYSEGYPKPTGGNKRL